MARFDWSRMILEKVAYARRRGSCDNKSLDFIDKKIFSYASTANRGQLYRLLLRFLRNHVTAEISL